jgi:hypothetical protein
LAEFAFSLKWLKGEIRRTAPFEGHAAPDRADGHLARGKTCGQEADWGAMVSNTAWKLLPAQPDDNRHAYSGAPADN